MILRSICCVCVTKKLIEQSNAKIKIKAFSDTQRQNCWQNQLILPRKMLSEASYHPLLPLSMLFNNFFCPSCTLECVHQHWKWGRGGSSCWRGYLVSKDNYPFHEKKRASWKVLPTPFVVGCLSVKNSNSRKNSCKS